MKSYGKADASWDDNICQSVIEDAAQMTREHEKTFAVSQDETGNVQVAEFTCDDSDDDDSHVYVCWTVASEDENSHEGMVELEDNVAYKTYTVKQMVPRVREALTRG